ncbi:hypothetical protein N7492_005854, partial [Penicillium capsulatum]
LIIEKEKREFECNFRLLQKIAGSSLCFDTPESLSPFLYRTGSDPRPVLESHRFLNGYYSTTPLSNGSRSTHIYTEHRLYGINYPEDKYNDYQKEAESALRNELVQPFDRALRMLS